MFAAAVIALMYDNFFTLRRVVRPGLLTEERFWTMLQRRNPYVEQKKHGDLRKFDVYANSIMRHSMIFLKIAQRVQILRSKKQQK